jgi:hypothetical protein
MDKTTDPTTAPSALDKVAAALAALGQDTAATIAERAGVGYSTATKRLRTLEEAGRAAPVRADDGPTLWRHLPPTSTGSADPSATSTEVSGETPPVSAPADDDPVEAHDPDEAPAPAEEEGTRVAAGTGAGSAGVREDEAHPATSDRDADLLVLPAPPLSGDSTRSAPTPPEAEGDGATQVDAEAVVAATPPGEAHPTLGPDPAAGDGSTAPRNLAAPEASGGGMSRRSKGSLRGAILDVLEAHPGQPFKTSQLCQAIDRANEGTGSAKASAGAVVNAVHKLVTDGVAVQVVEKPATFQLAPRTT